MSRRTTRKVIWIIVLIFAIFFVSFILANLFGGSLDKSNKIAIIPIKGVITIDPVGGFFEDGVASSTTIVGFIEQANEDNTIKAIVLEINSPGGTVVSSSEIANAIKETDKPVVAWIRELGASGAYWIASSSDYIVANKLSITGSIGVISSYLQFSDLFKEYGITYERLVTGKYKDLGTPFKELTNEERTLMQNKLNIIHNEFVSEVADNRGLPKEKVDEIATGIFLLGKEAYDLKLVDELGGKKQAIEKAKELANIKKAKEIRFKAKSNLFGVFSQSNAFYYIGKGIGSNLNLNQEFLIEAK